MSLSVCLSARITRNPRWRTSPIFCGLGTLPLTGFDTLCTSGFTNDMGPRLLCLDELRSEVCYLRLHCLCEVATHCYFQMTIFCLFYYVSCLYDCIVVFFEKHFKCMFLFYYFLRNHQQIIFTYMTIVMSSYVTYLWL